MIFLCIGMIRAILLAIPLVIVIVFFVVVGTSVAIFSEQHRGRQSYGS